VSAIAYFLESEGLQTTGISLVRENTEALKPPRFLWTTFPLGRPLGAPGNAAFQRRVILAALDLLNRDSGPVLEDYPEDAPKVEHDDYPACPVSFARPQADASTWAARLHNELLLMRPWYDLSRRRRGRTLVGVSKTPVQDLARDLGAMLDEPDALDGRLDLKPLKHGLEDLKAYYREALTAQPGDYDFREIERQLWNETDFGRAMLVLHDHIAAHEDPRLRPVARILAPRIATKTRQEDAHGD